MFSLQKVPAVKIYNLPLIGGPYGNLSFGQYDDHIPFIPKRYFVIVDVPAGVVRGGHAHRVIDQFLVCVKGSLMVTVDDGSDRESVLLDTPTRAVHIPPLIWATQEEFSKDATLLVLASARYDEAEYIRDYDEFIRLKEVHD
ncbi:MAG TPA: FdtA/QdtA family cupin domain-containing protein [Blastocatellia bacterium]|nr:FdtA/QdtA family cupin domain-containing protein [Blastocatellia bacterium]